ncbi:MAG: DUF6265 family protein [Acidobacteriia bacterium]|nr:DUF6265 family protein [Terriglobia bacterium]
MKSKTLSLFVAIMLVVAAPLVARAQGAAPENARDVATVKAVDFAWMTGRWIGRLQTATAEQICSTVQAGEMLCLFRIFVQGQPVMYELYTIYDTPKGVEIRSLNFPTDLTDKVLQQPLLMVLQKYSNKEVVFAGAPGAQVETSTLLRDSPTTMNGIIMFRDQKEAHIRVRWEKVAYDAKVNYNPPVSKP